MPGAADPEIDLAVHHGDAIDLVVAAGLHSHHTGDVGAPVDSFSATSSGTLNWA